MRRSFLVHAAWVMALTLGGCRQLDAVLAMHGDGGDGEAPPPTRAPVPRGTGTGAASAPTPEPLRDPRERRLRDVRQLTHDKVVASPRFTRDGKTILFLARSEQVVSVEQVLVQGGAPAPLSLSLPRGSPWALLDGMGGPCVVVTRPDCSLQAWPELLGLLPCRSLSEVPTASGITCPSQPDQALPCVLSSRGARACAMPGDHGTYIALTASNDAPATLLGPHEGLSFAPAFSPDGERLLFLAQVGELTRLWVASTAKPAEAHAIGPEARRMVDPLFTPSGDAVIFASSVDDTSDQELDLDLLPLESPVLERVTFEAGVDRFPVFSPDGKLLAWVSERNADPGMLDLFLARWVTPDAPPVDGRVDQRK